MSIIGYVPINRITYYIIIIHIGKNKGNEMYSPHLSLIDYYIYKLIIYTFIFHGLKYIIL